MSRSNPWERWDDAALREERIEVEVSPLLQDGRNTKFSRVTPQPQTQRSREPRSSLGQRLLGETVHQAQQTISTTAEYELQRLNSWQPSSHNKNYHSMGISGGGTAASTTRAEVRKTRQHVQTELQTLSSHTAWIFLLLPAGLALLALLLPSLWCEDVSSISTLAAINDCSSPTSRVNCAINWEHSKMIIQPHGSVNALKFLQLTLTLPLSALQSSNSRLTQDELKSLSVDVSLYLSENPNLDVLIDSPLQNGARLIAHRNLLIIDAMTDADLASLDNSTSTGGNGITPPLLSRNVSVSLVYESFDLPFVMSGKTRYATATVGLSGLKPLDSNSVEGIISTDLLSTTQFPIFASATIKMSVQSVSYTMAEVFLRLGFAILSLLLLFFSCLRIYLYLYSSSATTCKAHVESILPEQFSSLFMLASLFVYQSPLLATSLICALLKVSIRDSFLLFANFTEELAQFALLFCSLAYIDGLHCAPGERYAAKINRPRNERQRKGPNPQLFLGQVREIDEEASLDWGNKAYSKHRASSPADSRDSSFRSDRDASFHLPQKSSRSSLPAHHPLSVDFIDFLWPKVLLLFFSWACTCLFWNLKYTSQSGAGPNSLGLDSVEQVEVLLIALGILTRLLLVLVWLVNIFIAFIRTEDRLRTTKFFASRFRQMAFRLLSIQLYLGCFVFIIVGSCRLLECAEIVLKDKGILFFDLDELAAISRDQIVHSLLIYVNAGYIAPFGSFRLVILLFSSCLCFTIAYTLMPAVRDRERDRSFASVNFLKSLAGLGPSNDSLGGGTTSARRGGDEGKILPVMTDYDKTHAYIALESDLPDTSNRRGYQMFCLESALVLMELSYQSYYQAEIEVTIDGRNVVKEILEDSCWGQNVESAKSPLAANSAAVLQNNSAIEESYTASASGAAAEAPLTRPRMDVKRLNMNLLSVFYGQSSFGMMAESRPPAGLENLAVRQKKIIVCFRGTDNSDNIMTDLTVAQRELPQLRFRTKVFRKKIARCLRASKHGMSTLQSQTHLSSKSASRSESLDPLDALRDEFISEGVREGLRELEIAMEQDHAREQRATFARDVSSSSMSNLTSSPNRSPSESSYTPATPSTSGALSPRSPYSQERGSVSSTGSPDAFSRTPVLQYSELDLRNRTGNGMPIRDRDTSSLPLTTPPHSLGPSHTSNDEVTNTSDDDNICAWLRGLISRLPVLQQTLPLVHSGFWEVYVSMRVQVLGSVLMAIYQHASEQRLRDIARRPFDAPRQQVKEEAPLQICLCGHSLGGALALLASLDISANLGSMCRAVRDKLDEDQSDLNTDLAANEEDVPVILPVLSLTTFGAPRVGNSLFCNQVKNRLNTFYRVELEGDSVTMLPPNLFGFFKHCGRRVVVCPHGSGNLIVKPTIVETVLLSKSSYSVSNHSLDAYRNSLEACFTPDELIEYQTKEFIASQGSDALSGGGGAGTLPSWLRE